MQQFSHTFGLFDTRQFYRDKTVFLQLLDIGSNHTEAVDTRAQYIIRVVYRTVQFVAQNGYYLFVGRLRRNLVFQLEGAEDSREAHIGIDLLVFVVERSDKIVVPGLCSLCGSNSRIEIGVGVVIRQRFEHIGHRNLQRYIHTAFQVEAQTYFHFTALLIRIIPPIHLFRRDRVDIMFILRLIAGGILFRFVVVNSGYNRKRNVEQADKCKQNRNDSNKSFVLHVISTLFF